MIRTWGAYSSINSVWIAYVILEGPFVCYKIACAICTLYIWKIRSLRCNLYTINGRIGTSEGLGGRILEGFGVSGVDLQEPGNDFCGFELQKPSELWELWELLELSELLDFFRTFRTYKTFRTFRTLRIFRTFRFSELLRTSKIWELPEISELLELFKTFSFFKTTSGCDNFWMWLLLDVITPGCNSFWMWLLLDVTLSGCDCFWMWLFLDVTISGCDYFWMRILLDVITSGCDYFWMWLLLVLDTFSCIHIFNGISQFQGGGGVPPQGVFNWIIRRLPTGVRSVLDHEQNNHALIHSNWLILISKSKWSI